MKRSYLSAGLCSLFALAVQAQHDHHQHAHHAMQLNADGMVMNSNSTQLPQDCNSISETYQLAIEAGAEFALQRPDRAFGYNQHTIEVKPCSLLHVRFSNNDQVRHQWMVHGLPRYLYPQGMFHLEAAGGKMVEGSFIVPGDHQTYLIHCDIAQHMEKGMKAQLVVGKGSGNLWSIPGQTANFQPENRQLLPDEPGRQMLALLLVVGVAAGATTLLLRYQR